MSGNYAIRNPYEYTRIVGVGGDSGPIDRGYDDALAEEEAAQPDLEGGGAQMFATESFLSETAARELDLYASLRKIPNGSQLSVSTVSLLRKA